jgi:autotransporter adhesin
MNKCFRVIWNKARYAWVVACEFARGASKSGCSKRVVGATLALSVAILSDPSAALTAALEEVEEKNLIWVMQLHDPDSSPLVHMGLLGAGLAAYEAGGGLADAANSIAIGKAAKVDTGAYDAIAIGNNSRVMGGAYKSIAIGADAMVDDVAAGMGHQTSSSIALGDRSRVGKNSYDSVAVGYGAQVTDNADFGVALGSFATVQSNATRAMALGQHATANHANSVALGANSSTDRTNSVAVGGRQITSVGAGTQANDAVNLGQLTQTNQTVSGLTGSVSTLNASMTTLTGNALLWDAGADAYKAVHGGMSSKITDLAAGTAATDAVNKGQLDNLAGTVDVINNTGTRYFKANSTGTDANATGVDAIAIGEAAKASTLESLAAGANAQAAGLRSTAVGSSSIASGNRGTALGHTASASGDFGTAIGALARTSAAAADGVALGFNASVSNSNSVALGANSTTDRANSVSVGHGTLKRQVTNVAAGTQDSDAVNLLQLKQTNQSVSDMADSALLWDATRNAYIAERGGVASKISGVAAGDVSATSADAVVGAQLHQTNVRVGALEDGMSNSGLSDYFKANSGKAAASATGSDSVAAGPAASASGASSVAMGDGAQASGAQSSAIGANANVSHANSVALGAGSVSDRDNSVSVGSTGNERQITHVAAGSADTDAVNVAQLRDAATGSAAAVAQVDSKVDAVDARVSQVSGNVSNLQAGTDGMFQTNNSANLAKPKASGSNAVAGGAGAVASGADSSALGNKAQASGNNATAVGSAAQATARNSVGSAGATRQITNVAAGTQATDAVNLGQLNSGLSGARAHTDAVYNNLRKDIHQLDDELSAGIAGAMAMAALPQPHSPGASMTSVGVGNFRGESTVAVGIATMSKDGKWLTKMQGSTDSQGEVGVSVGVGYQWE